MLSDYSRPMDIRPISKDYAVSPQISPDDMNAIVEAGYTTIIDNRPDHEIPPSLHGEVMRAAAAEVGLEFVILPISHETLNATTIDAQMKAVEAASGPVLAYCASGTRSSILWALGQAGQIEADDILKATADAGYDLSALTPQLRALSS